MTEAECMEFTDTRPMLGHLRRSASDRKLRLFAVACCRRISELLPDEECRSALEIAERFADGLASLESLREAHRAAHHSFARNTDSGECGQFTGRESATMAVAGAFWTDEEGRDHGLDDVIDNCYRLGCLSTGRRNGGRIEFIRQCYDIRDIFGYPFRAMNLAAY